VIKEMFLA